MTTEGIGVGKGKQKFIGHYIGSYFFLHLAHQPLGDAFSGVDKATRQIERSFGRLTVAHHAEQLALFVENNGYGCCGCIGIIHKAALHTAFAVGIVFAEMGISALRTVLKIG